MQFVYKARFLSRFDRFARHEQILILEADQQIRAYYTHRTAPAGLGLTLLYSRGPVKVLEARASRSIRVVWAEQDDTVSFTLLGSHDEVKRYLHSLR